jgi:hypothetical protein
MQLSNSIRLHVKKSLEDELILLCLKEGRIHSHADPTSTGTPEDFDGYASDPDKYTSDSAEGEDWDESSASDDSDQEEDDTEVFSRIDPDEYYGSDAEDSDDESDSDYEGGRVYMSKDGRIYNAERTQTSIRGNRQDSAGKVIGNNFREKRANDARREGLPVAEGM